MNDTTLHYAFTYEGLEGGKSLFAHVHFGQRSVNGGVSFFLCGGGTQADRVHERRAATVDGDVTPADVVSRRGRTAQGIEPGVVRRDHPRRCRQVRPTRTSTRRRWPGGEIRGQINDKDQKEFDK